MFLNKTIKDKIGIDFYLKRISDISNVDLEIIKGEFNKLEKPPTRTITRIPQTSKSLHKFDKVQILFIRHMFINLRL